VTDKKYNLFAVITGSNALIMMAISANAPISLSCVGQSVAIPGEFQKTVAAPRDCFGRKLALQALQQLKMQFTLIV
jgi:hypothetical protein